MFKLFKPWQWLIWTLQLIGLAWLAHSGHAGYLIAGGLPLAAGGALTQQMMQGLATWDAGSWSTQAVSGSFTLTPAQILSASNNFLTLTGTPGAGFNVTTPTAAQLIAQFTSAYGQPPTVGSTFQFTISNTIATYTATLTAGTGVTINGTATVATAVNRTWLGTFTGIGTAAVTLQNIQSATN